MSAATEAPAVVIDGAGSEDIEVCGRLSIRVSWLLIAVLDIAFWIAVIKGAIALRGLL